MPTTPTSSHTSTRLLYPYPTCYAYHAYHTYQFPLCLLYPYPTYHAYHAYYTYHTYQFPIPQLFVIPLPYLPRLPRLPNLPHLPVPSHLSLYMIPVPYLLRLPRLPYLPHLPVLNISLLLQLPTLPILPTTATTFQKDTCRCFLSTKSFTGIFYFVESLVFDIKQPPEICVPYNTLEN